MLRSDQVLVTVGTACTLSAVGSTETYQALVARSDEFLPLAAFDAGLVDIDPEAASAVERGERHRRMLVEMAEIGMRLLRSLGELIEARVEQEKKDADAPSRSKDAAAACDNDTFVGKVEH